MCVQRGDIGLTHLVGVGRGESVQRAELTANLWAAQSLEKERPFTDSLTEMRLVLRWLYCTHKLDEPDGHLELLIPGIGKLVKGGGRIER